MAEPKPRSIVGPIAWLVFGSGFCALVYQMAWLRLLRLIFGSSTPATAAVLAIFMAGLGAGSLVLGPRADRQASPLGFYARLELGIAISAAISPLLIMLTRWLYITAGGSQELGSLTGTLVRVLLATLVLAVPTFLMGGTLPAVTRAVEQVEDQGRRHLGVLYGANTVGAVLGTLVTTFFSIEVLGIRRTIWVACLVNFLVALLARSMAANRTRNGRQLTETASTIEATGTHAGGADSPSRSYVVLMAAAVVGFAFFLMELVWYRMLAPLLGGSSYTFGLILAVALLGIGTGGLVYGVGSKARRPSLLSFATTCSLEAVFLIVPFAMGDNLAVAALVLRNLGGAGFMGLVLSWSMIVAVVVFPAAFIAGYQFPMLVAIMGAGRERVGSEVGRTYGWNTAGAILGSLAGGFGLIPLLSATGAWRLVTLLLVVLALTTGGMELRRQGWRRFSIPVLIGLAGLLLCTSLGPTAFWRHSPIGAGRQKADFTDRNQLDDLIRRKNRIMLWQSDGRESSIAMQSLNGAAFLINGKVDGSARNDASTQVMSGLIGAALHPRPETALVIGLGTGSTAGWLAEVPTMRRVDVVELEPDITRVASDCQPVNFDVLDNPKVNLIIGDGREILLTTSERYDVVFSEPSNPYRAGIASLFTRDFYDAVIDRLDEDGIFIQWLQAYEVDGQIVRTALATLGSVFPAVEIWHTNPSDLMLLASRQPIEHDPDRLRQVLAGHPYDIAMNRVWGVEGVEAFYAGFIASDSFVRAVLAEEERWINTDDRPIIEFGFARNVGRAGGVDIEDIIELAQARGEHRPDGAAVAALDWNRVRELLSVRTTGVAQTPFIPKGASVAMAKRIRARRAYVRDKLSEACTIWEAQESDPTTPMDTLMVAECLADRGDATAPALAERLRDQARDIEAEAILARWAARSGQPALATDHVVRAIEGYRTDPWPYLATMERLLLLASELARQDTDQGRRLFQALEQPFSVYQLNEVRRACLFDIAQAVDFDALCLDALDAYGPWFPWNRRLLQGRLQCYEAHQLPESARARRDLEKFLTVAPFPLDKGLRPGAD